MIKIKLLLAYFIFISVNGNSQTKLGIIYGQVDDSSRIQIYTPCFVSKNGKWKVDNTIPSQTMYAIYPTFRFAIPASNFKDTIYEGGEKYISVKNLQAIGYLRHQQFKFGEFNNNKPLPVCNKNNIKINELLFESDVKLITKKIIAGLKELNTQSGSPITINDNSIKEIQTVRKTKSNQFIIIATTSIDICKIDKKFINEDPPLMSLMAQSSRDKMLKKSMFLLTGTTLKIIAHEVDEIAFADFDGDGKTEMFISQLRETYNNSFLFCNNFASLISKHISSN